MNRNNNNDNNNTFMACHFIIAAINLKMSKYILIVKQT